MKRTRLQRNTEKSRKWLRRSRLSAAVRKLNERKPLKKQLMTVGLLEKLNMPPPAELPVAPGCRVLPTKPQFITVGLLTQLYIPAPLTAEFPLNVQSVTTASLQ